MAERQENSVLFSLKELKRIEQDRISKEEEERRRQEEEERRRQEEEERRRREEEERKLREEEERKRQEQMERERLEREAQLRLREAELRAKAEQEAKIEAERMRAEMEIKATHHKIPIWLIVTGLVVLLGAVGGLSWYLYKQSKERERQAELQRQREKAWKAELAKLKKEQEELRRLTAEKDALIKKLQTASEQDKAAIKRQLDAINRRSASLKESINKRRHRRRRGSRGSRKSSSSGGHRPARVHTSSNPLEGL